MRNRKVNCILSLLRQISIDNFRVVMTQESLVMRIFVELKYSIEKSFSLQFSNGDAHGFL